MYYLMTPQCTLYRGFGVVESGAPGSLFSKNSRYKEKMKTIDLKNVERAVLEVDKEKMVAYIHEK